MEVAAAPADEVALEAPPEAAEEAEEAPVEAAEETERVAVFYEVGDDQHASQ